MRTSSLTMLSLLTLLIAAARVSAAATVTVKSGGLLVKGDDGANVLAIKNLTIKTGKGDDVIDVSGGDVNGVRAIDAGKGTNTLVGVP